MTYLTEPYAPVPVEDVLLAFPATVDHLMPPPDVTKDAPRTWRDFQRQWFFYGLPPDAAFDVHDDVDARTAIRHLSAVQGTFSCKHEHKEAAVAFLASRWFVRVIVPSPSADADDPPTVYGTPLGEGPELVDEDPVHLTVRGDPPV